jgi:MoxR-like ATPase
MNNKTPSPEDSLISQNINYQSQIEFIEFVIDNMRSGANKRIMITGDTGLGKTSFVKQFARMLGLPSIVIEIPHIIEENLINIPFVIFDKQGKSSQGYEVFDKKGHKLVLGTSHLASSLRRLQKMTDVEYANAVKTFDPYMQGLIKAYEYENPGDIAAVRKSYERILFFDEFYRQTTPSIRNILRNVLNGRIGNDPIPKGTYTMYASNLVDVSGSIDQQSQHTSFLHKEYKAPTAQQWLSYTLSKSLGGNVKIKNDVAKAFQTYLTDENLSLTDINLEIRTSPRRWSNIFHYINSNYPFKSPYELSILMTTMKRQFQNDEIKTSKAYESLESIIKYLAEESEINMENVKPLSNRNWRDVLAQQVMTAVSAGEQKNYVPVLRGLPGIGKTAIGTIFEEPPYNLRFIPILATTINRESIPGMPIPDEQPDKVEVEFSQPELYVKIMTMIEEAEQDYKETLQEKQAAGELQGKSAQAVYADYQKQRYKYLIFIDEINRVSSSAIFNSLRLLILEKKFNDKYKLPKEALVVAAMNPDDLGTQPLTSHFRDAIDIIDADPDWKGTLTFLKNQVVPFMKKNNDVGDDAIELAINLIEEFPKSFSTRTANRETNDFYVNIGGISEIYINPRDYDNLFRELTSGVDRGFKRVRQLISRGQQIEIEDAQEIIANIALEKFKSTIDERLHQAGIEPAAGFYDLIKTFIFDNIEINLTKKTAAQTLGQMFEDIINGITDDLSRDSDFLSYMNNYEPNRYAKDFKNFLIDQSQEISTTEELNEFLRNITMVVDQLIDVVQKQNYIGDILERTYTVTEEVTSDLMDKNEINIDPYDLRAFKYVEDIGKKIEKSLAPPKPSNP